MYMYVCMYDCTLELKEGDMDGGETNAEECLEETPGRTIPRA